MRRKSEEGVIRAGLMADLDILKTVLDVLFLVTCSDAGELLLQVYFRFLPLNRGVLYPDLDTVFLFAQTRIR